MREFWKVLSFLILLVIQTDFSQQLQVWFPSSGSQSATLHLEKSMWFIFQSADFLYQTPDTPKKRRVLFSLKSIFNVIFLCRYPPIFLQQKVNRKPYAYPVEIDWKTIDSDPCLKILIVQIFPEIVNKIDSSFLSNWCFSVTMALIFLTKVKIKNFAPRMKISVENSVTWVFS